MAPIRPSTVGNGLVAVLLITRSKPGPKLVFHYPQQPSTTTRHRRRSINSDNSDSDTDGEHIASAANRRRVCFDGNTDHEQVLGHSVDSLEKLLTPGRWCDGKKFEVCVDGLTFVGHPTYSLEDGNWKPIPPEQKTAAEPPTTRYGEYHMYLDPGSVKNTPPDPPLDVNDFKHMPDSLDAHVLGTSMESSSTSSGRGADQISMFHIVFVISTRSTEGQNEAGVLYREVAKKLSLALQYLQKQSNYVATESRRILSLRTRAKQNHEKVHEVWRQLVETSELAWALGEIYERTFVGDVAGIRLNGMEMSLHVSTDRPEVSSDIELSPFSAILLLETKEALLHQLSHPEASLLAHFVREQLPTKDLQKHSTNLGIPINDVLYFAQHLVKWRKAKVIAPLHQRNSYVVGPEAPLDQLPSLAERYSKSFPTLPSLPNMLKVLSGRPIKYGLLIPSRDHRVAYIDILSFLVQHKLVTQLQTYGWLCLPNSIIKAPPLPAVTTAALLPTAELDPNKRPMSVRALLSPRLRPIEDDEVSISSERTAIPLALSKSGKRLSSGTQISLNSAAISPFTSTPSHTHSQAEDTKTNGTAMPDDDDDDDFMGRTLILDPTAPTAHEAELIAALPRSLTTSAEMREHFPDMARFFNGESAFEQIAARLGLKRAKVEEWLDELEKKGFLLCVRHI